jgi:hypothetical protein
MGAGEILIQLQGMFAFGDALHGALGEHPNISQYQVARPLDRGPTTRLWSASLRRPRKPLWDSARASWRRNSPAEISRCALLGNTLPTGAILVLLILIFGPVSGAHMNPALSLAMAIRGELSVRDLALYVGAQLIGAIGGVLAAHVMFHLPIWQLSTTVRTGPPQWFAEFVATFGLLLTILGYVARTPAAVPYAVGLYITAVCWLPQRPSPTPP